MKKIIFFIIFIFISTSVNAKKIQTSMPVVYIKNFTCKGTSAKYNIVNKSSTYVRYITIIIYDSDNDPIDSVLKSVYVKPGTGDKQSHYLDCASMTSIGFKAE